MTFERRGHGMERAANVDRASNSNHSKNGSLI